MNHSYGHMIWHPVYAHKLALEVLLQEQLGAPYFGHSKQEALVLGPKMIANVCLAAEAQVQMHESRYRSDG